MKNLALVSLVCVLFAWGCQSSAQKNMSGTYNFDSEKWKSTMSEIDPNFSKAPAELVDKMLSTFNAFTMVVQDQTITANFGTTTMTGTLTEVSKSDSGTVYKMIPADPAQEKQTILVTINGTDMTAGPEGDKRQLLYFKKNEAK